MKSAIGAVAFAALISIPAFAADVSPLYKAAPKPVSGWGGAYAGIELGGKWGDATWSTKSIQAPGFPATIDASSPAQFRMSDGRRVGGFAGYNWQSERWVYGFEFDAAYAAATSRKMAGFPGCAVDCLGTPGPGTDFTQVRMNWDASARARIGYLVTPALLIYETAGAAWQSMQTSATCQNTDSDPLCFGVPGAPFNTQTRTSVLPGWTGGGGFEMKLAGNLMLRAEYRFAHFSGNDSITFPVPSPSPSTTVNYRLSVDTHLATVGLTYKFDGL